MPTIRIAKFFGVCTIALFFTIVGIDNIIDYQSNWLFVQHVLAMDTTFKDPAIMWRAIVNPLIQTMAYWSIIAWQLLTAVICWYGAIKIFNAKKADVLLFCKAKAMAITGLLMGFLLYMLGFIIVGGEWFAMWQSSQYNGQMKAGLFISLIMFVLIFLCQNELRDENANKNK